MAGPRDVRRCFQHECAQHVRDRLQPRLIGIDLPGIADGEFRDFLTRPAAADLQIAAVVERQEIRDSALDDAQSVLGKPQISNDLGIEQRHRVGRDRIAEARMEFSVTAAPPTTGRRSNTTTLSPAIAR